MRQLLFSPHEILSCLSYFLLRWYGGAMRNSLQLVKVLETVTFLTLPSEIEKYQNEYSMSSLFHPLFW